MQKIFLISMLALGLAACANTATDGSQAEDVSATGAASAEPKKRCYREKETGTRLGRRVCVVVAE